MTPAPPQNPQPNRANVTRASRRCAPRQTLPLFALLPLFSIACQSPHPDLPSDFSRATNLQNAISFHSSPEPLDTPQSQIANQKSQIPTLSLPQAVHLSLSHDPRIQSSLARVRAAEADAHQSRLLPNPILNVDVRVPNESGTNTVFEATLTGDLIAVLQKPAAIRAADNRLRAAASDALTTCLDVLAELQSTYASALAADAAVTAARKRTEILTRLRDIANKRLQAGDAPRLDLLTLDSQLEQANFDLADLRLTATQQRLTLARLIGEPSSQIDWTLANFETPLPTTLAPESAWIRAALLHRPELASRAWELRALGDDLDVANLAPLQGSELGAHTEHDPEWRTGPVLTIPLPIFDFGQAARAKLQAQRLAARNDLLEQQREIVQEIRLAYATYLESSRALTQARDHLLPLQDQLLRQAQLSYQSGDADLPALLLAESEYQQTAAKIIDLQSKASLARIKLLRAAGGPAFAPPSPTTSPSTQPAGPQ